MRTLPAAALVALLLLPTVLAADPEPVSWGSHNGVSAVVAVALAAEGPTIAAALGQPPATSPSPGTTPRVVTSDLAILDVASGFAMNGSGVAPQPLGRTHVAVSRDGSAVASLGRDTKPSASAPTPGIDPDNPAVPGTPSASADELRLAYHRAFSGANFSGGRASNLTVYLGGQPVGLLLSDDGRRIAVATNEAGSLVVRGFLASDGGLTGSFTYRAPGNATALAADGALTRIYVAGQLVQPGASRAALLVIPFDRGVATASHVDAAENGTHRSVSASRDGNVLAVGAGAGGLLVFDATGGVLGEPRVLQVGGAADAVAPVVVSEDGSRIATVAGRNLTHVDATGATLSPRWSATTSAAATSLALNRTGGLVAATVPGEGVLGYGDQTSDVLWRNTGAAVSVKLSASGDVVAFGRNSLVIALRVPRGLSFEHAAGQDAGPLKLVKPGATVSYDLVVRNTGAAPELVGFEAPADPTLLFSMEPAVAYVKPGESRRVSLLVEADPDFAGSRALNVTAVSLTSGARDETTVRVGLQTQANVSLLVNETDLVVQPGEPTTLLLGLQNKGNRDAAVGVRARQQVSAGAPWDVVVDPASLTLAPTSRTTLRVVVTPPADVANGTSLVLTVSLEGQDVSDSATVTLRVNPTVDLDVGAVGRMKFIQPGKVGHYNVTVKNTGSLARAFEAYYDVIPTEGAPARGWTVDMSTTRFELEPGATKVLPVTVRAPFDVTPTDRVSVRVTARLVPLNDTEPPLLRNVTLFANGEAPAPTPPTEDGGGSSIPSPAPALLAATLALAALLRRRLR